MGETIKQNGYTVKIIQDEDAQGPDEWGDDDLFIVTTRNRYFEVLHDKRDAHACMEDVELTKKYWIFPVTAYIHSGVALSLSNQSYPFNDQWDSGQIGFVFAAKDEWKYRNRETKTCVSAFTAAKGLVEEWNKYLSGDVWGYTIEDANGEQIDSCWGFYGFEYCKSEALSNVPDDPPSPEEFEETLP